MVALLFAVACTDAGGSTDGSFDTSKLFPAEDGSFAAYRHLAPGSSTAPGDTGLDESDLLFARLETGGCGGDAWRIELRTGGVWDTAAALGALHLTDAAGLAVCAYESADGTLESYDPAAALWNTGEPLADGEPVVSGGWTVTPTGEEDLTTYFGVFPRAVAFTLAGSGALDGWVLHLAPDFGIVLVEADTFTADLVYTR